MPDVILERIESQVRRRDVHLPAAIACGPIAGVLAMGLGILLASRAGAPLAPLRTAASYVLGPGAVATPGADAPIGPWLALPVGLIVLAAASLAGGAAIGVLLHRVRPAPALIFAAQLGLAAYLLTVALPSAFWPWLQPARTPQTLAAYALFALAAAAVYKSIQHATGHDAARFTT